MNTSSPIVRLGPQIETWGFQDIYNNKLVFFYNYEEKNTVNMNIP